MKARILEQVNLIYTQGQQDAEEKDLARTMLADFLSKNSGKKEIFGDGTAENPGLLGQIIENPEYYEQNKKLIDRIYEEYVRFDETLSEDAKAIIQEKLLFLAGSPAIEGPKPENTDNTDEAGTSFLSKFQNLGKIFLWLGLAIIGLFGAIFAWGKVVSTKKKSENREDAPHPEIISETPPIIEAAAETTPDWLKSSESPFGSDDILSQEVSQPSTEAHTPDWMNDNATAAPVVTDVSNGEIIAPTEKPLSEQETIETPTTIPGEVPEWLRDETIPEEESNTLPIDEIESPNTLSETEATHTSP